MPRAIAVAVLFVLWSVFLGFAVTALAAPVSWDGEPLNQPTTQTAFIPHWDQFPPLKADDSLNTEPAEQPPLIPPAIIIALLAGCCVTVIGRRVRMDLRHIIKARAESERRMLNAPHPTQPPIEKRAHVWTPEQRAMHKIRRAA